MAFRAAGGTGITMCACLIPGIGFPRGRREQACPRGRRNADSGVRYRYSRGADPRQKKLRERLHDASSAHHDRGRGNRLRMCALPASAPRPRGTEKSDLRAAGGTFCGASGEVCAAPARQEGPNTTKSDSRSRLPRALRPHDHAPAEPRRTRRFRTRGKSRRDLPRKLSPVRKRADSAPEQAAVGTRRAPSSPPAT